MPFTDQNLSLLTLLQIWGCWLRSIWSIWFCWLQSIWTNFFIGTSRVQHSLVDFHFQCWLQSQRIHGLKLSGSNRTVQINHNILGTRSKNRPNNDIISISPRPCLIHVGSDAGPLRLNWAHIQAHNSKHASLDRTASDDVHMLHSRTGRREFHFRFLSQNPKTQRWLLLQFETSACKWVSI